MEGNKPKTKLITGPIVRRAILDSFRKLSPRVQVRNPVMFVVAVGAACAMLAAVLQHISAERTQVS